ncbi:unnamed protein product [Aureobasidium uvarum]|uniref:Uncharacterized protein n=1 Tax=Aureobasidium uvarum TaxID=2773716 RepID=A0A9N8KN10_9PEZI|nr:unnamed protein product [Aureobasidium uvarum]
MAPSKVKFLTGAPITSELNWSDEGLLNTFSSALQRHLDAHSGPPPTPTPTQPLAKWRSVPLVANKPFHESPVLPRRLPQTNIKKALPRQIHNLIEDRDDDFLDHSFALEADLQSSQIAPHHQSPEHDTEEATFMTDDSVYSTFMDGLDTTIMSTQPSLREDSGTRLGAAYRPVGPIMSIKAIPTADYLQRIQPQTMTVNLLVGIISIAPARTVTTRKGGHDMDIIELTVGDETKAPFTISSWHAAQGSQQRHKVEDKSRNILSSLRSQDIVLIERVALSSFRNAVFGQSLNRRATKNATAITVLHRPHDFRADSAHQSNFPLAVENKLERVRDWVSIFVGPNGKRKARSEPLPRAGSKKKGKSTLPEEFLPADSQP